MPSGRTHDRITLWSLPLVAGLTFERTQSSGMALLVSGGFLFGGLMFGPDLDVHSRQYRRWGLLRWIWLPYRRSMRHRSFWSHGPLVGTVVRLLYLLVWLVLFGLGAIALSAAVYYALGSLDRWQIMAQQVVTLSVEHGGRSLQQHANELLAIVIGLELGALSHSLSDWCGSRLKRLSKRWAGQGMRGKG